MSDHDVTTQYNYDDFTHGKFDRFMDYANSPALGEKAPDGPLWQLDDRSETTLSAVWKAHAFTMVEFGSYT